MPSTTLIQHPNFSIFHLVRCSPATIDQAAAVFQPWSEWFDYGICDHDGVPLIDFSLDHENLDDATEEAIELVADISRNYPEKHFRLESRTTGYFHMGWVQYIENGRVIDHFEATSSDIVQELNDLVDPHPRPSLSMPGVIMAPGSNVVYLNAGVANDA